jgi:hypothetical protein
MLEASQQKRKDVERKRAEKRPAKVSNKNMLKRKGASSTNDWYCLLCDESRVESMIECTKCKMWAHELCAGQPNRIDYICDLCQ